MIVYNKLVRDKIPEIIKEKNQECSRHVANENEYRTSLQDKLTEEVKEFLTEPNEKELADILEVINAINELKGRNVEQARIKKANAKGGFNKRIPSLITPL